jgi:heme/copper-type cytochrome/quinol oxidase subunit 3
MARPSATPRAHVTAAPATIDVAGLPCLGWGPAAAVWWGVWSLITIEGTVFVLLVSVYIYLRGVATTWPPPGIRRPGLSASTTDVLLLLASVVPTIGAHRAALRLDRRATGRYLVVATALSAGAIALRALELTQLHVRWDGHAYGSIVWTIMGTHLSHLIASTLEDVLLCALVLAGPIEDKHYVNITVSCLYWYFVVAAWIPLYVLVYWLPRWG